MAPPTAPAVLHLAQVMEKAMGMTAEPMTIPMNCNSKSSRQAALSSQFPSTALGPYSISSALANTCFNSF